MLRLFPALALVLSLGLAGSGTVSAAPLITVETAPGDDAAIIDGVKRTHAPDPRTKLFEVTAETSGGITVLKGRTDSAEALSDLRAAYYVQKRPVDVRVKLLPDSDDLKKKVWAFTTAPVTRITDLSGRPVTTVPAGTPAARLDEKDGMTLLRLPDGSIGLARSTDVRPCTETEILIRNRHERLIVTADKAVFKPLQEESAPSADVVLPRGAVLRLDGAGDGVMRAALPDGRRGTIAVSAVEKLADFERREESERRSDPAAFMKALSETAVREAASGRHADGGSFLRSVSSPATSSCSAIPTCCSPPIRRPTAADRSTGSSPATCSSSGLSTASGPQASPLAAAASSRRPTWAETSERAAPRRAQRFASRSKAPCASIRASSTIPASPPPARTPTGRPPSRPSYPAAGAPTSK